MTILVKLEDEGVSDWGIIELQGDLESRSDASLSHHFVGDLHYSVLGNIPILIIGHHIFYGKIVTLGKPFAVMEKDVSESENSKRTQYTVKALVKKKIVFRIRPKPIIGN